MSQFLRVAKIARKRYMTLRDLERAIYRVYHIADTQTSISARLRDTKRLAAIGLVKEVLIRRINGNNVWYYRLAQI